MGHILIYQLAIAHFVPTDRRNFHSTILWKVVFQSYTVYLRSFVPFTLF